MILSISATALAAGLDRRTVQRAIKSGRISTTQIDTHVGQERMGQVVERL